MNKLALFLAFLAESWHRIVSPYLPGACRFEPTCSMYMAGALRKYGFFKGFWLGLKRLARCHPFGSQGFDPVP
jgi:uncharacterized protein